MKMIKYLFFDPGESTGVAGFDENGDVCYKLTVRGQDGLFNYLNEMVKGPFLTLVGIEDFRLYPWKSAAQSWSQFWTVQAIGAIKYACNIVGFQTIIQSTQNRDMGYTWAGLKQPPKTSPIIHEMDAYAHGVYCLQRRGIRRPQQARVT